MDNAQAVFSKYGVMAGNQPLELAGFGPGAGQASSAVREAVVSKLLSAAKDLSRDDRAAFLAIADHESGFNPSAKNPKSSAYGVFQIINKTWSGLGKTEKERSDVDAQIAAGLKLFKENVLHLRKEGKDGLRGEQRARELYRLHHDGPGGLDQGGAEIADLHVIPKYRLYLKLLPLR